MLKRSFDVAFSLAVLVLLGPLLLAIAVLIKFSSSGPALYRGDRVGLLGRKFRILKLRTMVVDAENLGGSSTSEDDPRITRVGAFLRRYKLDELPQFLNVLSGEMSVVGPRPQVPWAVDLYTPEQRRLLDVRPGITDRASLKFRDEGEILRGSADPDRDYLERIAPEKIRMGIEYVDHADFLEDLRIIAMTAAVAFRPGKGS